MGRDVSRTATPAAAEEEAGTKLASTRPGRASGWTWPRATPLERVFQALACVVLGGGIGLGLYLEPSPTGSGTHTILGLPPCGMLVSTGKPCPTCGVTTSFALAAHGRFGDALVNQPFGLVLFALAVAGVLALVTTLAAGRSWGPVTTPWSVTSFILALIMVGLVSWIYRWWTT